MDSSIRNLALWASFLSLLCQNYCTAVALSNWSRYHHQKLKLKNVHQISVAAPSIFEAIKESPLPPPIMPPLPSPSPTSPKQTNSIFELFDSTAQAPSLFDPAQVYIDSQNNNGELAIDISPHASVFTSQGNFSEYKVDGQQQLGSAGFETIADYYIGAPRLASQVTTNTNASNNESLSDSVEQNSVYKFTCEKTSELLKRLNLNVFLQGLREKDLLRIVDNLDLRFTIFAPSDFAFQKFLQANRASVDNLLSDQLLDKVLLYHIVSEGEFMVDDLYAGLSLTTLLEGADLVVDKSEFNTIILSLTSGFDGMIVYPDAHACNSIVHVVDGVLMPDFDTSGNLVID